MKKLYTFPQYILSIFLLIGIMAFGSSPVIAQVYTGTDYYYNNFDGGAVGTGFTATGASTLGISSSGTNNLAVETGYCLNSTGVAGSGGFTMAYLTPGTVMTNETYGHEWTFVYRNNSASNPDGSNDWKYWLMAQSTSFNTKGYYITQVGDKLQLRYYQDQYYSRTSIEYTIANNTTYTIRVQRLKNGKWYLFVDPYSTSKREASTSRGTAEENEISTYTTSGLIVSSNSSGRFKFDEMKMYSMKLAIVGANDLVTGISNPLVAGQTNAAIMGLQAKCRGLFDFYQIQFSLSGNITSIMDANSLKLKKSVDNVFGNGDDTFLNPAINFATYDSSVQYYGDGNNPNDRFYSIGNADGSSALACYYYIIGNVRSDASTTASFTFTGAPTIQGAGTNTNYAGASSGSVTVEPSAPSGSGKVYDWVGGTSVVWGTAANWSPSGVPGTNDLARIGVNGTFTNQPNVQANTTVGSVAFGSVQSGTLSVDANKTLTIIGNLKTEGPTTITGAGAISVATNLLIGALTATDVTATISVASFSANNVKLNSEYGKATFNANSAQLTFTGSIQTLSTTKVSTFTLGSTSNLTLTGAKPLAFTSGTAGNNVATFTTTGTIEYGAAVAQTVYTSAIPNSNSTISYKNIKFSGAGTKTTATGTLTIPGNWDSASGKVDLATNNTTVSFTGTTAQAINDTGSDAATGVVFGKVNFSGAGLKTLSANGKFSVGTTGILTMGASSNLVTSGNLTLKSAAASTATVATIPANASISGNVTVERYVQGGPKTMFRTYRMFSSPIYDNVASVVTTNTVGDRSYKFSQFIDDMIITGSGGAANGFDATSNNMATAFIYNSNYIAVTNINTAVNAGRGTYIFYRGNRNNMTAKTTGTFVDPESTIITFKGYLNQQNVTVPITYGAASNGSVGYSLLGNPYAASIDWNSSNFTKTNIAPTIRIWNPAKKQYATYNGLDSLNGGSRYIGSGQAFFVQTLLPTNGSITFKETVKVGANAQPSTLLLSVGGKEESLAEAAPLSPAAKLRILMLKEQSDNVDESLIVLKEGSDLTYTAEDVSHLNGEEVLLSTLSSDQKQLAINYVPEITSVSHVGLNVNSSSSGNFSLKFNLEDVPMGYGVQLVDRYAHSITNVVEDSVYPLVIDKADTASFGANRFVLMFNPPVTLPVTISTFTAAKTVNGVLLKWITASETNNHHFDVERAGENGVFVNIGRVDAKGVGAYSFIDKNPLQGNNYYRLTQVDNDGKATANKPIPIKFDNNLNELSAATINIYPNPVIDNFIVKYNGSLTSDLNTVTLVSPAGQVILTKTVSKEDLMNGYNLNVAEQATGVYILSIKDGSNSKKVGAIKMIKL